jgi:hypothetical protein
VSGFVFITMFVLACALYVCLFAIAEQLRRIADALAERREKGNSNATIF